LTPGCATFFPAPCLYTAGDFLQGAHVRHGRYAHTQCNPLPPWEGIRDSPLCGSSPYGYHTPRPSPTICQPKERGPVAACLGRSIRKAAHSITRSAGTIWSRKAPQFRQKLDFRLRAAMKLWRWPQIRANGLAEGGIRPQAVKRRLRLSARQSKPAAGATATDFLLRSQSNNGWCVARQRSPC
jgi:hypothetical protein